VRVVGEGRTGEHWEVSVCVCEMGRIQVGLKVRFRDSLVRDRECGR